MFGVKDDSTAVAMASMKVCIPTFAYASHLH
jgi:hypothetical protein